MWLMLSTQTGRSLAIDIISKNEKYDVMGTP